MLRRENQVRPGDIVAILRRNLMQILRSFMDRSVACKFYFEDISRAAISRKIVLQESEAGLGE
ncbi:hypothetical protein [Pseudoroseomonas cervicalis]|uniref:hypothetical protein n=1 Tax=Teichococcus cervicalis TaxID=204525 RepID=UPI0022F172F5|nr:hypothetical protein [Pseudoroseomonas cervicalis]WBV43445.1 hypothetical protein PFY06_02410 [Pseudoroseomonas cervicalis]